MLSVAVIAKNEEDKISTCLESVKWADEIIVVDNASTDKTKDIAKKYTEKIFSVEMEDFSSLRTFAFDKTKGDWILYVDADERVLKDLKEEILTLVSNSEHSAYALSRKNIIFGKEEKYGPFWPDWVIRLIKKSDFISWVGSVHEYATFKGSLGYTKKSLLHLTHRNIDQIVLKSLDYSKIDANLRLRSGHPKMVGWRLLRILLTETINQGIIKKGFFSGTIGVIDSILQVFSLIITYIRLWEFQQPKTREQIYKEIDEELLRNNFSFKL